MENNTKEHFKIKVQETLKTSTDFKVRSLFSKICSHIEELKEIELLIKEEEKRLASALENLFKEDADYDKILSRFLNIKVVEKNNERIDFDGSLLTAICKQIAESLNKYNNEPVNKANSFLNFGGKFYDIPQADIKRVINTVGLDAIKNRFNFYNGYLQKYGVFIHTLSYSIDDVMGEKPLKIHLRIFL